jgi:hypothetical protein
VTCEQYAGGTAPTLGQINYTLTGANKIANNVNPGVFFFYSTITVSAGTVTTTQSNDGSAAPFTVNGNAKPNAYLWTYDTTTKQCTKVYSAATAGTGVTFANVAAGTYVLSVQYDSKSIAGSNAPTKDPTTYTFSVTGQPSNTNGTVVLKKS